MKALVKYLTENKIKTFNITLRRFFNWYNGGEKVTKVDAEWLEYCGLDYLVDDLDMSLDEVADLFNKHLKDKIEINAQDIGNTIENVFELDGKTIAIDSVDWFGTKTDW